MSRLGKGENEDVEPLVVSCEGGLVLDKHMLEIPQGAAAVLQNFEPDIEGGYRRILGFEKFDSTAVTGSGAILGIAIRDSQVVACRGANVMYGSGAGWTSITTGRTNAGKYGFDKYNWGTETLVMVDGINEPAIWDGTTYTELTGALGTGTGTAPTNPSTVAVHRNHIFFGQSNLLTFTAPFFANKFAAADGGGQINVGFTITAMKAFREELYVFGVNKIVKIAGSDLDTFAMTPVAENIGCLSQWSLQEVGGDLVFLAPDGIRTIAGTERIGDVELGTISKPIQARLNNITEVELICSAVIRKKSQYRMWLPADATADSGCRGIIGVIKQNGWEWSDILGVKPSYAMSDYIDNVEYILHGGYTDGFIYRQERTNAFNTTTIAALYRSPELFITDIGQRKTLQRLITHISNLGNISASLRLRYNFGQNDTPQPDIYGIQVLGSGTTYGTGIYGTSLYSLESILNERQSVEGSGFTLSVEYAESAQSSPFSIKGFQIEYTSSGRR